MYIAKHYLYMQNIITKIKSRLKKPKARVVVPRSKEELKQASKHPFAVPVITFAVLFIGGASAYLVASIFDKLPAENDANIVVISHDGQKQTVPSSETTVSGLLKKLNIAIHEGDVVEPSLNTEIDQDQFRINVYRAVPVTIVDGDNRVVASSAARTPRAIAQQTGTQLYPEDNVTTSPAKDFLKPGGIGEEVKIARATPVNVDLYGTPVVLRTHAKTVGELAKEKNIKLVQNDRMVPSADTPISEGQKISFIRTGTKTETVTEEIATPVETINDNSLAYGTKAVRQQGSPGQKTVTYEVELVNNVVKNRKIIQEVVNKEAVKQIEVMGTSLSGIKGDMARAGIAPGDFVYADFIISKESGWRPNARNASGAYGLCQAMPGSKMASAGADWQTNPVTQLKWCDGYAKRTYGSWAKAHAVWQSKHWW